MRPVILCEIGRAHIYDRKLEKMVWILIPVVLLIGVMYLLFAPLFVEVDSEIGLFRIRLHHIASAALRLTASSLIIDLNVAGWKKPIDLLGGREKVRRKELKENGAKAKPIRKQRKISFRRVLAVLRSFKVKTCQVVADTGDMPLNGMLYPVFYWLSIWSGQAFRVSFNDENEVKLNIENNMARMLWTYFRTS